LFCTKVVFGTSISPILNIVKGDIDGNTTVDADTERVGRGGNGAHTTTNNGDRGDLGSIDNRTIVLITRGSTIRGEWETVNGRRTGRNGSLPIEGTLFRTELLETLRAAPARTNVVKVAATVCKGCNGTDNVGKGDRGSGCGLIETSGDLSVKVAKDLLIKVRIIETTSNNGDRITSSRERNRVGCDACDNRTIVVSQDLSILCDGLIRVVSIKEGASKADTDVVEKKVDAIVFRDVADSIVSSDCSGIGKVSRKSREHALVLGDAAASESKATDGDRSVSGDVSKVGTDGIDDGTIVKESSNGVLGTTRVSIVERDLNDSVPCVLRGRADDGLVCDADSGSSGVSKLTCW